MERGFEGHSDWVSSVAFSPDSKQVVSGSDNPTVRLWDAATGALLQTLEGHNGPVNSVAFSPDSKQVVSGSDDQTVQLWDAAIEALLQTREGHTGYRGWPSILPSFLFSNPPESAAFVSSTTIAPQLDAAQHVLIETLLKEGFETKLIASEASCSVQRARRSENPFKETVVRNAYPKNKPCRLL